ncbi:hypothetical protein CEXT_517911 [Caerostris extrusa]|uniref:Uncharacterized protein n=1 Tax=Caerostris extrusa TaxID=172846 RepID=A0AAV4SFS7_CAEEX|nr:hypothetical protein CEXT_517911 [Caerostris extrusa]
MRYRAVPLTQVLSLRALDNLTPFCLPASWKGATLILLSGIQVMQKVKMKTERGEKQLWKTFVLAYRYDWALQHEAQNNSEDSQ